MESVVDYLCSAECLPRTPGRPDGFNARRFLQTQLEDIGLEPAGENGYLQEIDGIGGANLIGRVPGSGPLADCHVLIGAHYDACDPDGEGLPGAGDNAAAVAVALEVARTLQVDTSVLGRSVLVALFDAEEPWYFLSPEMGSQWFVDHPTVELETIDLMICLDLVGHSLGGPEVPLDVRESIFVLGAELGDGTGGVFDRIPPVDGIQPRRISNFVVPPMSDYDAFINAGISFLFYTAGRSVHYHVETDRPDTLDYKKMEALADHLTAAVSTFSRRPAGEGRFLADGADDTAMVQSLKSILGSLGAFSEDAALALMMLDAFAEAAAHRDLDAAERSMLTTIVPRIENAMAG
jgi:hypothetical protein